jgi:hypothetical protein
VQRWFDRQFVRVAVLPTTVMLLLNIDLQWIGSHIV